MMAGKKAPEFVITGVGVVSPVGIGNQRFWSNLVAGRSGIGPLNSLSGDSLPCKLAAEIHDFDPLQYVYEKKLCQP